MRRNKPERRAEALLDAASRDDALLPFLARHGDAARRHDLAGLVFPRRSDGDELLGGEARIEQCANPSAMGEGSATGESGAASR